MPIARRRVGDVEAMTTNAARVVTPDETAGVQTGELLLVTEQGTERLHAVPRGCRPAG